jgi:hypothetical protein
VGEDADPDLEASGSASCPAPKRHFFAIAGGKFMRTFFRCQLILMILGVLMFFGCNRSSPPADADVILVVPEMH